MSYRIQSVARLTGIAAATLRAWERRYHLVAPGRSQKGYRLYDDEDVARLTRIKAMLDEGLRIGEAVERVRRESPTLLPADSASPQEVAAAREGLLAALLEMDRAAAVRAYDRLAFVPPLRRLDDVLLPLLHTVGDLWACGDAHVAQEHFASAFVRERLAALMEALEAPGAGPEAVCAGLAGERHEFGLIGAALHLAAHGFRVTYLGPDLPMIDLGRVLQGRRPALLCVSLVRSLTPAEYAAAAAELRRLAPAGTRVVLGGRGIPGTSSRPDVPGVDVCDSFGDLLDRVEEHAAVS
ncbi:MAG: Transcriptional regulator, MerR family [Gemmatimonadetes bacterium]|nr:Transcriptional regulator, MerR family [Gemmatimonadota bacterium]